MYPLSRTFPGNSTYPSSVPKDPIEGGTSLGFGPRPAGPHLDPATQMSKARAAVLEQLGRHHDPTTVGVLAAECGQHTNTVREHLDALASAGLVVRTTGPAKGRGRPAIRYAAVPPESVRPQMKQYVNLASALSEHVGRVVPDARTFGVEAGRLMQLQDDTPEVPDLNAAEASLKLLSDLGFDPDIDAPAAEQPAHTGDASDDAAAAEPETETGHVDEHGRHLLQVQLRQCPLLEAARRHPDVVCSVHLGAILGIYESRSEPTDGIRVVPFAGPGYCLTTLPVAASDED